MPVDTYTLRQLAQTTANSIDASALRAAADELDTFRTIQRDLEEKIELTRGAMQSQDGREREAGERCGVDYNEFGCDWPAAAADKINFLRTALAEAQRVVAYLKSPGRLTAYEYDSIGRPDGWTWNEKVSMWCRYDFEHFEALRNLESLREAARPFAKCNRPAAFYNEPVGGGPCRTCPGCKLAALLDTTKENT